MVNEEVSTLDPAHGGVVAADRRANVAHSLLSMLAEIKKLPRHTLDLSPDDDFLRVLDMDSIDAVELTLELDSVFDLGFGQHPDDLDHLATFGKLVDLVLSRGRLEALDDDAID